MKRTATLLGIACVFALFSCKKDIQTPMTDLSSASQKNLSLVTVNGVTENTDTIPPSTAVNVLTLGVKGDGVTDDTQALQAAFNSHSSLLLKGGTYLINTTLTMSANLKIYGTNGATVKAGNSMSGKLLTNGWYLLSQNTGRNSVINLTFTKSSEAFNLGAWANSVIFIENSPYCTVNYCKFNFSQPYQHSGVKAVWCEGTGTVQSYVCHNTCNTVGIEYAEAGASGTICDFNTVNNSNSNALEGDGNGSTYCTGIQIMYNTVNNAGYNGIVDWGIIDGSAIRGNVINGSGKSPSEGALGEGIQAVGINTAVTLNTVFGAQAQYIECGSPSTRVDSNTIVDNSLSVQGIVVECMQTPPSRCKTTTAHVDHNNITGCLNAIEVAGNVSPSVVMTTNTITNPKNAAIDIVSNATSYNITLTSNNINFTKPSTQTSTRCAIIAYPSTKTSTQLLALTTNKITYSTSAAGGAGSERAIYTTINNATLTGNVVTGNSIKSAAGYEVSAMDSMGIIYTGYTFLNNTFTGCLANVTGFQTIQSSGNIF